MRKKGLNYVILLVLLGIVAYNSVYFKKLDEVKASAGLTADQKFDAKAYAQNFWTTKLLPTAANSATDLSTLIAALKTEKEKTVETYSHALGIGNIRYFLVKGEGRVTTIGDNDITVELTSGETFKMATEYIFGNAARDASGLLKITEFDNTMDLNNVSAELNSIIRSKVVPPFRTNAKVGGLVKFIGAIELNKEHLHLEGLEIIPVSVEFGAGIKEQEGKSLTIRMNSVLLVPGPPPYSPC